MPVSDPGPKAARRQATTFVDGVEQARGVEQALRRAPDIALDCEAAGFHRYSDRLCLVQLSTRRRTFVLDPLAIDLAPHLKPLLEDPERRIVMHGAAFDLRLLARDLDIRIANLADTQVAASLVGEPAVGLQALLAAHLGIRVSKRYQRADWARRPLTAGMIEYAAGDTCHLHDLVAILEDKLHEAGRLRWAEEECRRLCESAAQRTNADDGTIDPVTRFRRARRMDDRSVTALREVIAWRDRIAQARDRAPFRVVSDQALLEVVVSRPASVAALARVKGFPPRLAHTRGLSLLDALDRVDRLPAAALAPYPKRRRGIRWTPEDDATLDRLKEARNSAAVGLGLERGRVMSNQALRNVVAAGPRSRAELTAINDVRQWQIEILGDDLLDALRPPGR